MADGRYAGRAAVATSSLITAWRCFALAAEAHGGVLL
jgi:hypothetical protein